MWPGWAPRAGTSANCFGIAAGASSLHPALATACPDGQGDSELRHDKCPFPVVVLAAAGQGCWEGEHRLSPCLWAAAAGKWRLKPHLTLNQPFSSPGFGVSPSPWLCTARALHHSWHLRYDLKGADPMERSWRGRLRGQRERGSATWPPKRSRGSPVGSHGCTPGAVVTSVRGGCSPCPQQWLCLGPRDSPATPAWQDTRARGFFNLFLPVGFFFLKLVTGSGGKHLCQPLPTQ